MILYATTLTIPSRTCRSRSARSGTLSRSTQAPSFFRGLPRARRHDLILAIVLEAGDLDHVAE